MAKYAKNVLVETNWVARNKTKEGVRIIEVDEDTDAYEKGHIPGAVGLNWRRDLHDPLRREFLAKEDFEKLMDRLAVTNDTTIVLYGGNNNWFAAYAYWLFRYLGHRKLKLMNGGRKKWELENRELTNQVPSVTPTSGYKSTGPAQKLRAFRDWIEKKVLPRTNGDFALVDVRSPEEFRGELLAPPHLPQEQAQVPGHIPHAKNIPWSKAVNPETGEFLDQDALKSLYEGQGVTGDKEVVAYCRIGERSAHTWFVLSELLGFKKVRNYDGSWTEWGSTVGTPVER
jgi:thiosulfate/3-mercaptopyruvate sulfurtransferase